jgi:hypothetical protein
LLLPHKRTQIDLKKDSLFFTLLVFIGRNASRRSGNSVSLLEPVTEVGEFALFRAEGIKLTTLFPL